METEAKLSIPLLANNGSTRDNRESVVLVPDEIVAQAARALDDMY